MVLEATWAGGRLGAGGARRIGPLLIEQNQAFVVDQVLLVGDGEPDDGAVAQVRGAGGGSRGTKQVLGGPVAVDQEMRSRSGNAKGG